MDSQLGLPFSDAAPYLIGGSIAGGTVYFCYSLMFDALVLPILIPPGAPVLSYGQEWGMIMLPLSVMLGLSAGAGLFFSLRRRVVFSGLAPLAVSVAAMVSGMWHINFQRYGNDPTDLVLFFPLLVGCMTVGVFGVWLPMWAAVGQFR